MPATRPNRLKNPLRKLRLILGDGKTPITQEQFASRTGLPLASFRSVEGGRRPLSKHFRMQILATLGATWNQKKQGWFVLGSDTPYEKKYENAAEFFNPEDPYIADLAIHMLFERILMMFDRCTSYQKHLGLLLYLNQHLLETAEGFGLYPKDLQPNEPIWHKGIGPELTVWGKRLAKDAVFLPQYKDAKGYRSIAPEQIFDFRFARTFRLEDYPGSKTPVRRDETAQKTTAEKQTAPEQKEIFSAPITHPNAGEPKNSTKKKVEKDVFIGSQT